MTLKALAAIGAALLVLGMAGVLVLPPEDPAAAGPPLESQPQIAEPVAEPVATAESSASLREEPNAAPEGEAAPEAASKAIEERPPLFNPDKPVPMTRGVQGLLRLEDGMMEAEDLKATLLAHETSLSRWSMFYEASMPLLQTRKLNELLMSAFLHRRLREAVKTGNAAPWPEGQELPKSKIGAQSHVVAPMRIQGSDGEFTTRTYQIHYRIGDHAEWDAHLRPLNEQIDGSIRRFRALTLALLGEQPLEGFFD